MQMRNINALFLVVALLWLASCGTLEERRKRKEAANQEQKNKTTEELSSKEETTNKEEETANKEETQEEQKVVEVVDKKTNTKYYVIVGSFKEKTNAANLHKNLSQKGASAEVLEADNNFTRVSEKSFKTKEEALEELKRIRTKEKKIDAWLLTTEKQ